MINTWHSTATKLLKPWINGLKKSAWTCGLADDPQLTDMLSVASICGYDTNSAFPKQSVRTNHRTQIMTSQIHPYDRILMITRTHAQNMPPHLELSKLSLKCWKIREKLSCRRPLSLGNLFVVVIIFFHDQ